MFSIRLPHEVEARLAALAEREGRAKSDLVREALADYLGRREQESKPYDLGRDLFGRHGSGMGNLSVDYKRLLKEKLRAKRPAR